jgi:hypothetical protein
VQLQKLTIWQFGLNNKTWQIITNIRLVHDWKTTQAQFWASWGSFGIRKKQYRKAQFQT